MSLYTDGPVVSGSPQVGSRLLFPFLPFLFRGGSREQRGSRQADSRRRSPNGPSCLRDGPVFTGDRGPTGGRDRRACLPGLKWVV